MLRRYLLVLAMLALFRTAKAAPAPVSPRVGLAENQGFCPGTPNQFGWDAPRPGAVQLWTTLCGPPAPGQATAVTQEFRAPAHLALYLLGWMRPAAQGMWLENVQTQARLAIHSDATPGGGWQRVTFAIPRSWQRQFVRLRVETSRSGDLTWVGFSEPFDAGDLHDYRGALNLLARASEYYALLSFIFLAAVALALRAEIKDPALLVFSGLAAAGAAGYAAFWFWLLVPKLAHLFSFGVPLIAALYLVAWWRVKPQVRGALLETAKPWLLVFSVALFVLAAGFLFGDVDCPLIVPKTRFSHQLPMDNILQFVFSEQILAHKVQHPMISDWLSSDRPPLQTGFNLLALPFVLPPHDLAYQVLSVLLQSYWAPALWAFLAAFGIARKTIAWVLAAAVFSGLVLVNNFFVWPKLLSAAYTLGFVMLLLAPRFERVLRLRKSVGMLSGALLALGMLSHGGSAFAVLGVIPVLLLLRRRVPLRALLLAAAACVVFYAPWMAYQKIADPPGDRLLKMHLAGVSQPTPESFFHVLSESYARTPRPQIAAARESNWRTMVGSLGDYWRTYWAFIKELSQDIWQHEKRAGPVTAVLRSLEFFHFFPALGLLMPAPLLLLAGVRKRFRNECWRAACVCWLYVFCTLVIWILLLFSPQSAYNHQGTYVANLLAITGCVLVLAAFSRALMIAVVSLHSFVTFVLYVVYGRGAPAPGMLAEGVVHTAELLLLIASLVMLAVNIQMSCADKALSGRSAETPTVAAS